MLTSVLSAIAAIATIVGAGYGIFKWVVWKASTTPEQTKEDVDKKVDDEESKVKQTGRPQP